MGQVWVRCGSGGGQFCGTYGTLGTYVVEWINHAGCVRLTKSKPLADVDWRRSDAPALALLDALADSGWAYGKPPEAHTAESPMVLQVKDPNAGMAYLRCSLQLDEIAVSGQMPALRSDQSNLYYACVLVSPQPDKVPLGATPIVYQALLAELQSGQQSAGNRDAAPAESDTEEEGACGGVQMPWRPGGDEVRRRASRSAESAEQGLGWHSLIPVFCISTRSGQQIRRRSS